MNETDSATNHVENVVRNAVNRGIVAVGLLGVALIHVLDGIGKYSETRYLFWMFIGLSVSAIVIALALLFTKSRAPLVAAAVLIATALIGYVLSRTTGLPNAGDDIGNWTEPIGVANVFIEAAVVTISTSALLVRRHAGAAAGARGSRVPITAETALG